MYAYRFAEAMGGTNWEVYFYFTITVSKIFSVFDEEPGHAWGEARLEHIRNGTTGSTSRALQ